MLVRLAPGDEETHRALVAGLGKPLLTADNPAGPAIGKASPTRIFSSAFATLEVHQPIPPPDGRSPAWAAQPPAAEPSQARAGCMRPIRRFRLVYTAA